MSERETKNGEVVDNPSVQILPTGGLSQADGAMIDIQVSTAKRYPRSIGKFKEQAKGMATIDVITAEACTYDLPRAGKTITGASVRLAEIAASAWGNLRVEAKVTGEDGSFVYAEAIAWDLETNAAFRRTIRRRITNKHGKRFNDDMIAVTANATSSIAKREAIFDVVPRVYVREIEMATRALIAGDIKTLPQRREALLKRFNDMGIDNARILAVLDKHRVDDIDLDDFVTLKGIGVSIRDGEITAENAFPRTVVEVATNGKSNTQALADKLEADANKTRTHDEPAQPGDKDHVKPAEAESEPEKNLLLESVKMLNEMYAGDTDNISSAVHEASSFIDKETGETKGGKDKMTDLTKKQLPVVYGKIKKAYKTWQELTK